MPHNAPPTSGLPNVYHPKDVPSIGYEYLPNKGNAFPLIAHNNEIIRH